MPARSLPPRLPRTLSAALVATVVALDAAPPPAAPPPRPNIVLVMSDDQGWGDVGYNGNPRVRTPHLDTLAREGLRLDRFYAAGPVCSPTRGSCLTGRHPSRYGIDWADDILPASERTLPQALKAAGYRAGHFGKWHLGEFEVGGTAFTSEPGEGWKLDAASYGPPWERGFDVCFSDQGGPTYNPMVWGRDRGPGNRLVMNRPVARGETTALPGVVPSGARFWTGPGVTATGDLDGDSSRVIMDRALRFIETEAAAGQPFLAVVWMFTPHAPIAAGNEERARYPGLTLEEQHWYGCLSALDDQIGRLRRRLRELGIADNTVLWFCSDNGPSWVLREFNSAGPYRGEKGLLYEGGIRVPGLLEWPARFRAPRVVTAPISTSDLYPTLLRWAGVGPGEQAPPLDGLDVTALLDGTQSARPEPIAFQSPVRMGLGRDWSTYPDHWRRNPDPATRQLALSDNRFKLISTDNGASYQLYDLAADPGESTDVAAAHPRVVAEMRSRLQRWLDSCRQSRAMPGA
ncbi:MAG: sulfatase-like hydrolase/transferase [Opitutaceae bacterium]|nr:sulfatase-like hydrolase/transferase [Opitutaceae bacterium]